MNDLYFEVRGIGTFPVDMLRYDCAWPRDEHAAGQIEWTFEEGAILSDEPIRLMTHYKGPFSKTFKPSTRWKSFGWQVVNVETGP